MTTLVEPQTSRSVRDPADPRTEIYLRATDVRRRYGISAMWIHRRLRDDSGFPHPFYVLRTRFWKLSELEAWEAAARRRDLSA